MTKSEVISFLLGRKNTVSLCERECYLNSFIGSATYQTSERIEVRRPIDLIIGYSSFSHQILILLSVNSHFDCLYCRYIK